MEGKRTTDLVAVLAVMSTLKNPLRHPSLHLGKIILVIGMVTAIGVALWKLQLWMQPGTGVPLGSWHLGVHEFQVWQRKNTTRAEPFATGLFVRNRDGKWRAYCLDIDGLYKPTVALSNEGSSVFVSLNGKVIGEFNSENEEYRRKSDSALFQPQIVDGMPPGDWWLRKF